MTWHGYRSVYSSVSLVSSDDAIPYNMSVQLSLIVRSGYGNGGTETIDWTLLKHLPPTQLPTKNCVRNRTSVYPLV